MTCKPRGRREGGKRGKVGGEMNGQVEKRRDAKDMMKWKGRRRVRAGWRRGKRWSVSREMKERSYKTKRI